MDTTEEKGGVRDGDGCLSSEFLRALSIAISCYDRIQAQSLTQDLHEADMADVLMALSPEERVTLIEILGRDFDVEALPQLDQSVRDSLMEALPNRLIASVVQELDTDDAAYLIEGMDLEDRGEILSQVPRKDRVALERALEYPEGSAGRLMQTSFVAALLGWSVGDVLEKLKRTPELPEEFFEVYVVDRRLRLKGVLPLSRVVSSAPEVLVDDLMDDDQTVFQVLDEREDIAFQFKKYHLFSAAVVDGSGRLVGMLTIDDVVEVIQEEATEDILRLGGVGDEELSDSVFSITRGRFSWLFVNLLTALLASWVISFFEATLSQQVSLAILMPIVASMGGNAGTQTMTIAVRSLAMRTLGPLNMMKIIVRECAIGFLNGVIFALFMGGVAWWWFGTSFLGAVIAMAMVVNLLAAALAGILIPVVLDRFDIDPAIASGVFVTTVTDVVGFFAFLGLASYFLL